MRVGFSLEDVSESVIRLPSQGYPTVQTSHNLIDLSSEPEAIVLLSGDQASVDTPARWPSSVCKLLPLAVSQILIVASAADTVS